MRTKEQQACPYQLKTDMRECFIPRPFVVEQILIAGTELTGAETLEEELH